MVDHGTICRLRVAARRGAGEEPGIGGQFQCNRCRSWLQVRMEDDQAVA